MDSSSIKVKSNRMVKSKTFLLCIVFLFFSQMMSSAQKTASVFTPSTTDQRTTVSVDFKKVPLAEALQILARKVNVGISYKTVVMPPKRVTYRAEKTSLFKVLDDILKDTGLQSTLSQDRKVIMIKKKRVVPAKKQETVSGTVTDNKTGDTLPGVNIRVKGTSTGTSTDANGEYELTIESLQDTLVFTYVGYHSQTVPINGRPSVSVSLKSATSSLDEMVVTGVGVATERRKLGNTIGSVKSEDLENVAVSNPVEMLSGRVSGLTTVSGGGAQGVGSSIRLRGSSSLSLSNDPLIYVDGVRYISHSSGGSGPENSTSGFQTSRINDINPANIDHIEVLKGASAATLYGSQANSGIIQIFTKSGQAGEPTFSFTTTQSIGRTPRNFPGSYTYNSSDDNIAHINSVDKNLEDSYKQKYTLSASGGSDDFTYYGSVFFNNSKGVIPETKYDQFGSRVNLKALPSNMVTIDLNLAYTNTKNKTHPAYGHPSGYLANMILASPNLVSNQRPNGEIFTPIDDILLVKFKQNIGNFLASSQLNVDWGKGVNTKFSLGYNIINNDDDSIWPLGQAYYPSGRRSVRNEKHDLWTIDLNTSWKTDISKNLGSSFVFGAQAYFVKESFVKNDVGDLAGRGIPVLRGGASIFDVDESAEEVKNAGFFLQEQLSFWEQLFVTGGVRFDGSSAFGDELNTDIYPKFGVSYAPTMGFDNFLSSLRIRGSYGESGQQPGAFDAQRTYTPTSYLNGKPGIRPGNLGNEDLKPERSTEVEVGVDAGFLEDKINLDITYFNQHTSDALFPKQFPVSQGFLKPQLLNIGRVSSQGIELGIETEILNNQDNSGLVRLNISTLDQKVEDLGGSPPLRVGNSFRAVNTIAEGQQPGALMGVVVDPDNPYSLAVPLGQLNDIDQITANTLKNRNGHDKQKFLGNVLPTLTGSLFFNFNIGRFVTTATLSGAYGAVMWNEDDLLRNQLRLTKKIADIQKELKDVNTTDARKKKLAMETVYLDFGVKGNWVDDADYIRLQDFTIGYQVPVKQLDIGVNNLTADLSFKNLFTITNYDGYGSPGTSATDVSNTFNRNQDRFGLPISRIIQLKIKADF